MDDHGGGSCGASDLSLEELMEEYSSRPPQVAEWLWCIEYVAKFVKDIRCILDLMNMGYHYQYADDYGKRINEVLSLRVLEFMFDPTKNDSRGVGVASASEERVEFDLSLSNAAVIRAILREIPVSELQAGMPELSKFNVLPFIAHKNMCLPQCALEKLRDLSLMENETSAAPEMAENDPVCSGYIPVHMDICEEEPIDEQQVHIGLDKVTLTDDETEAMHTNEKDTENDYTTGKTFPTSSRRWPENARVKCTKDGTCLVSGSDDDDESDMVKDPALAKKNKNIYTNLPRAENVCWKCGKEGTLLICSRSECASKVHKECSNCVVNFDEDGNFHCPVCWYDGVVAEYLESQKLMSSAKRRMMKFMPLLSTRSKRLRSIKAI
ncbi:uncharacterized protein BNAC05G10960D isoform X1 [Brassica napus]|uniref:uncharacterized protein BNAC05G10960D isoform X1 n=1 Tax=Brassica napus TaxID=3708 RepID=UPI0006AB0BFC|nr:uncharacterized protein BNAC05G10960D isoform X1 [Brassica napus]XP_013693843.1 uncharacterized protein BNAC05G10960D isoform X1 [Brassica napus]